MAEDEKADRKNAEKRSVKHQFKGAEMSRAELHERCHERKKGGGREGPQ